MRWWDVLLSLFCLYGFFMLWLVCRMHMIGSEIHRAYKDETKTADQSAELLPISRKFDRLWKRCAPFFPHPKLEDHISFVVTFKGFHECRKQLEAMYYDPSVSGDAFLRVLPACRRIDAAYQAFVDDPELVTLEQFAVSAIRSRTALLEISVSDTVN